MNVSVFRPKYPRKEKDPKTGEWVPVPGDVVESATWWYEFTFAGNRIRESAKTTRKTIAVDAEKRRRLELERALAGLPPEKPEARISTIAAALKTYEKAYTVNHRPKSVLVVKDRAAHLARLIGGRLLPDATPEQAIEYMAARQGEGASNRTINLELMVLSRAMGQTWKALWPRVRKLEENRDVGCALEPAEEAAVLDAAARSQSRLIYPYLMVLIWTGMRSDEARLLRWSQVDFETNQVTVGRSKTEAGAGRMIPMSAALRAALEHHAAWCARKLGPIDPGWYVFPASNRLRPIDASKPVTALKRAWNGVREKAGVSCRLHDLRHSFCTKLAEAGVPESTMLDMMGHMSAAMLRRYSHIRAKARRDAITAIEGPAVSIGVPQESPQENFSRPSKSPVTH